MKLQKIILMLVLFFFSFIMISCKKNEKTFSEKENINNNILKTENYIKQTK